MIYDLVVIGGGPAGNEIVAFFAKKGLKTLIFEQKAFGGTCLNVGCIPSKGYLHRAKLISELSSNKIAFAKDSSYFFLEDLQKFTQRTINRMSLAIEKRLMDRNVEIKKEKVAFLSKDYLISSSKEKIFFKKLILATGTFPRIPEQLLGIESLPNVFTNESIFNLQKMPESMTIVGGGVIGVEMAYFFASFGVPVTIIEGMSTILSFFDNDLILEIKKILKRKKVNIIENEKIIQANQQLEIKLNTGEIVKSQSILIATGRLANIPDNDLNLDKISNGYLKVNECFQTSQDNIYAIGDVNGISLLAHSAADQSKQLCHYLLENRKIEHDRVVPSIVYTSPSLASVGIREKDTNEEYVVKKLSYSWLGRAHLEKETEGIMKIIFKDDIIVGAHIVGAYAEEIIAMMGLAVQEKMSKDILRRLIIAHPTYSELFMELF
jgi:dihydrolipoamide dehydrogenase